MSRRAEPGFASTSLELVLGPAEAAGVSRAVLLADAGLPGTALPERVAFQKVRALWLAAVERTADPAFGLRAAAVAQAPLFDVLGFLVRASPTLGDALERVSRFARLTSEPTRFDVVRGEETATLRHRLEGVVGEAPPAAADCMLALAARWVRTLGLTEVLPLRVCLRHASPVEARPWREAFNAPVVFGAEHNELHLPLSALEQRIKTADPALAAVLERHAEVLLKQMPSGDQLLHRVQRLICERLAQGDATLGEVAARLHLSRRTLQRRLETDGTSFEALLDDVRRELALQHLTERETPQGELAFLLGFSDASTFHRAFRRWTGQSPGAWRRSRG